jgi:radical SAM protein with 4Fe4S-binding SPASM domain
MEKSVEAGIKTVQISFDGAKPRTLENIRTGADYKKLLENICEFNNIKSNHGAKFPVLRFNYVIMKDNITEVEDVVKLAKDIGVEEINFRHLVPLRGLGIKLQSLTYSKQLAREYLLKAEEKALKSGIRLIGFPLMTPDQTDNDQFLNSINENNCFLPWEQVHILPDGRIIPCPFWYNETSFGDLKQDSFGAIWNSDDYNMLRWELSTGRWRKICTSCPYRVIGDIYSGNFDREVQWGPSK